MIEVEAILKGGVGLGATIGLAFGLLMVFASMMSSNPGAGESTGKAGCTLALASIVVLVVLVIVAVFA